MPIRECLRSDLPAVRSIEDVCYGAADALPLIALTQYLELLSRRCSWYARLNPASLDSP
jgi:hypothetical protein